MIICTHSRFVGAGLPSPIGVNLGIFTVFRRSVSIDAAPTGKPKVLGQIRFYTDTVPMGLKRFLESSRFPRRIRFGWETEPTGPGAEAIIFSKIDTYGAGLPYEETPQQKPPTKGQCGILPRSVNIFSDFTIIQTHATFL